MHYEHSQFFFDIDIRNLKKAPWEAFIKMINFGATIYIMDFVIFGYGIKNNELRFYASDRYGINCSIFEDGSIGYSKESLRQGMLSFIKIS